MPDETTSNPAPANTPVPQAPETPISTPLEAVIVPVPEETPVAPAPTPEPMPEPASGQMGGNEPIELAPAESIPPAPTIEPVLAETTQPTPTEPVIETVHVPTPVETLNPAQATIEATPVAQVETPAPAQIPEPVVSQVPVSTPTSEPVIQTPTPDPAPVVTPAPTPTQTVASVVAPIVAPVVAQTFTKSIRELFTKAQLAIQNRKRKKIDRILTLFAKQTTITNNEVEKLLHVSDATATRYLSTLEKEGKIKQNTKKGHSVSYSKI